MALPRAAWIALLVLMVPISSLTGLAKPMDDLDGFQTFLDVWKANFWGDAVFTLGTILVAALAAAITLWAWRQPDPATRWLAVLAIPVAFFGTWLVYAVSWSLTGEAFFGDGAVGFWEMEAGWEENFEWTWDYGKAGMWTLGFLPTGAALAMQLLSQSRRRGVATTR